MDEAVARMRDLAALWSIDHATAAEIVDTACDLLVAGHDGTHLAMLAGVQRRHADAEAPELLPGALREVGLEFYERESDAGYGAALRVMARRLLAGQISPRYLADWAHVTISHDRPIGETLVRLSDEYGMREYSDLRPDEIDAEVVAEARRLGLVVS